MAELRHMQMQRLKPKFGSEDGMLDRSISACMKDISNVLCLSLIRSL